MGFSAKRPNSRKVTIQRVSELGNPASIFLEAMPIGKTDCTHSNVLLLCYLDDVNVLGHNPYYPNYILYICVYAKFVRISLDPDR